MKKPEEDLSTWAKKYESGGLTLDERKTFEDTFADNEEALNELNGFFSAYQAQVLGTDVEELDPTNQSQIQPIPIVGRVGNDYVLDQNRSQNRLGKRTASSKKGIRGAVAQFRGAMMGLFGTNETEAGEDAFGDNNLAKPHLMPSGKIQFRWKKHPDAQSYTITLLNSKDWSPIWSVKTQESWTDFDPNGTLDEGCNYLWEVTVQFGQEEEVLSSEFQWPLP